MARGELDRGEQAAGIGAAAAGQIERGAMIDRGAHDRQPERDVDGVAEAGVLEHRQTLIVVHGQHHVVAREVARHEQRIGGQRAVDVEAQRRAPARSPGAIIALLLVAQVSALAGVRIEAADARCAACGSRK